MEQVLTLVCKLNPTPQQVAQIEATLAVESPHHRCYGGTGLVAGSLQAKFDKIDKSLAKFDR